ncbi:MAG: 30S ribosome-binding factor RbfA [Bacteroidota bacterium]
MESIRQQKINRLLSKELSNIFRADSHSSYDGAMITVTVVKITKDMSIAKVYLSLFLVKNKEEMISRIKENTREIRYKLGTKVKDQLRITPELEFFLDDSLDYIENIDNLLKQ